MHRWTFCLGRFHSQHNKRVKIVWDSKCWYQAKEGNCIGTFTWQMYCLIGKVAMQWRVIFCCLLYLEVQMRNYRQNCVHKMNKKLADSNCSKFSFFRSLHISYARLIGLQNHVSLKIAKNLEEDIREGEKSQLNFTF